MRGEGVRHVCFKDGGQRGRYAEVKIDRQEHVRAQLLAGPLTQIRIKANNGDFVALLVQSPYSSLELT